MKLIYRYIIREFFKPLLFTSTVFGGLVLISEFFRELNFYLENKIPFSAIFAYLLYNLPWWIIQVLPVSVLLAVLFSLGQLAKQGEITAMKAAGINPWKLIWILSLCGLLIGISEVYLREKVIPLTVKKADFIRKEMIHKEPASAHTEFNNLVIALPDNGRMTILYLNAATNYMRQIVADYYDSNFKLIRQIAAQDAVWKKNIWTLNKCVERFFVNGNNKEQFFETKSIQLSFKPQDFVINRVRPEQMSAKEYLEYIKKLQNVGIPAEKDLFQFHLRWASVFSHMIVMLIGIPFALGLGSKHGKILSFTFALIFAFIYWGVQAVGQSLGENGIISPMLAAWSANILFGAVGLFFVGSIRK